LPILYFQGVQHALAGTSLIVVKPGHDLEQAEAATMQEISNAISLINRIQMLLA
jgi:translation initiation factor 5B